MGRNQALPLWERLCLMVLEKHSPTLVLVCREGAEGELDKEKQQIRGSEFPLANMSLALPL